MQEYVGCIAGLGTGSGWPVRRTLILGLLRANEGHSLGGGSWRVNGQSCLPVNKAVLSIFTVYPK